MVSLDFMLWGRFHKFVTFEFTILAVTLKSATPLSRALLQELVSHADGRLLYWMYTLLVSLLLAAICRIVAAASPWRSSGYQLGDQSGSE